VTLQRYNKIVWAVVGTVALLGAAVLAVMLFFFRTPEPKPPTIVLGKPNEARIQQNLVFCEPIVVPGTQRQLLPVAAVNAEDANSEKSVVYFESALSRGESSYYPRSGCGLHDYSGRSHIFNVVVRDTITSRESLLLNRPAQIAAVNVPARD
jgi:hypothetical protein